MLKNTRRQMLVGLGLSPFMGFQVLTAQPPGLVYPSTPMRFTHRLEKSLRNGETIMAERAWKIEFKPHGRGVQIRGVQVSALIAGPEKLERMKVFERERSTASMWPITLSEQGRMVDSGDFKSAEDVRRTMEIAIEMLEERGDSPEQMEVHRRNLATIAMASEKLTDLFPEDLFYPSGQELRSNSPLDVSEDQVGTYELIYTSEIASDGPWLKTAMRNIVTKIGDNEQWSRDDWTMGPF